MRDIWNNIVRIGDTLEGSYGIPPTKIEATVVRIQQYGQGRLVCLTPGHTPKQCTLAEFVEAIGNFEITKRKYEKD